MGQQLMQIDVQILGSQRTKTSKLATKFAQNGKNGYYDHFPHTHKAVYEMLFR